MVGRGVVGGCCYRGSIGCNLSENRDLSNVNAALGLCVLPCWSTLLLSLRHNVLVSDCAGIWTVDDVDVANIRLTRTSGLDLSILARL